MSSKDMAIEIKGLMKKYEEFNLIIPSLNIEKSEVIGLIGENGAGKSTLIKLILNLIEKDSGEINITGYKNNDPDIKKYIGVVFENCCFSGFLNIMQINKIFKDIYKDLRDENKFFKYINDFSLPETKLIAHFSLGMKAKLSLIVALSHNPKLLILDEATSNLDPIVRKEINDIIFNYAKENSCTVIFSTHLVNELEQIADQIIFMDNGKIMMKMDAKEINNKYYIIEADTLKDIPKNSIAYIKNEDSLSYLTDNKPSDSLKILNDNITLDTLMYYIKKGEKIL